MLRSEPKVVFYTADQERNFFVRNIENEIEKLEELNVRFVVFRDGNSNIPKMLFNGYVTMGIENIKNELCKLHQIFNNIIQKTLIWIFSPPDKRKHLSSFFKKQVVTVYDIDDKIKSLPQNVNQGLRDIITKNSRTTLQSFWTTAVDEVMITISNSSAHTAVMLGHLLYYKEFTKELFSIFDTSFLIQKATEREIYTGYTVLIIDDIYDIFNSLKKPDELFGTSAFYDFLDSNFGRSISENKPDYKPHMSWIHYCLNSILNWRIQEITLGQNISNQTNSRFILWGLKQNTLVLLKLISPSPEQEILYLSHPISEPRREFKEKGNWPNLVKILNNFQRELLKKDILIQMYTSIDEYRLDKDRHGNYTTFLTPRWPLEDESKKYLSRMI